LQGPFFFFQRKLLADLCLKHKIPLAMGEALSGEAGALFLDADHGNRALGFSDMVRSLSFGTPSQL
jgi:hypothetical protein